MKNIIWLSNSAIELDVRIFCIKGFSYLEMKEMVNNKGYNISKREFDNVNDLIDEEISSFFTKERLEEKSGFLK